jgi:hypothetical protein
MSQIASYDNSSNLVLSDLRYQQLIEEVLIPAQAI